MSVSEIFQLTNLPFQTKCDILDVYFSIRPAARIMTPVGDVTKEVVKQLCDMSIHIAVGKGIVLQKKQREIGVVDWFSEESLKGEEAEKMIVLYISKEEDNAKKAREGDETQNDSIFGKLLGYPDCCVEKVSRDGKVPEHKDVIHRYTEKGMYDPLCWPGAMAVDMSLLIHYPCSKNCAHSKALVEKRLQYLRQYAPPETIEKLVKAHSIGYALVEGKVVPETHLNENFSQRYVYPEYTLSLTQLQNDMPL